MALFPRTTDPTTTRGLDEAERAATSPNLARAGAGDITKGTILRDVTVGTSDTKLAHRLGYQPSGWWPIDVQTAGQIIHRVSWDETFITLKANSAGVASIRVF